MRILIATTGVLPPVPVAELCKRLGGDEGEFTVMTVVQVPRTFLDALDEEERRSLRADDDRGTRRAKASAYLERGRRAVDPILAALAAQGLRPVCGSWRRRSRRAIIRTADFRPTSS